MTSPSRSSFPIGTGRDRWYLIPDRDTRLGGCGRSDPCYDLNMDDLLLDARRLADELRPSAALAQGAERSLLRALEPFLRTFEVDGQPQRGSTEALGRFCVDSLEWASPLFARCTDIVERARAKL
jgi:hypothetical protein